MCIRQMELYSCIQAQHGSNYTFNQLDSQVYSADFLLTVHAGTIHASFLLALTQGVRPVPTLAWIELRNEVAEGRPEDRHLLALGALS